MNYIFTVDSSSSFKPSSNLRTQKMDFVSTITPEVLSQAQLEVEDGMKTVNKALVTKERINSYLLKLSQHLAKLNNDPPQASAAKLFAVFTRPSITLKDNGKTSSAIFLASLLPFCTAMAHYNNIIGRQLHAETACHMTPAALEASKWSCIQQLGLC